jgi:hypothetical protein
MSRRTVIYVIGLAMLVMFAGAASITVYRYMTKAQNPLPATISSKLTFSPFVLPSDHYDYHVSDYRLSKTEDGTQLLSFRVLTPSTTRVDVSEYPEPPQFTDIPEYKDRFLSNVVQQYQSVSTANGTIYLGKLAKQSNRQVGVMLERGLIMFLNPNKEMDAAAWRQLGDKFEIQKPD